jgi:hypothetical protein
MAINSLKYFGKESAQKGDPERLFSDLFLPINLLSCLFSQHLLQHLTFPAQTFLCALSRAAASDPDAVKPWTSAALLIAPVLRVDKSETALEALNFWEFHL